ncbi:MAG: hypothetical protein Q7U02_14590 [Desulfosalsimonadaceae bacterium]|nr:hypothetical protein [Desulfosalsimonadaceae bacterium]
MRKSDFRNPLLQSGVLLFIFLLFFSFVASSSADDFGSGLLAIISGISHSVLFLIGLIFSVLLSIVLLIILFLTAIALYSTDKAKDLWLQLQTTLFDMFTSLNESIALKINRSRDIFHSQTIRIQQMEKELSSLKKHNRELQDIVNNQEKHIEELHLLNIDNCREDSLETSKAFSERPSTTVFLED